MLIIDQDGNMAGHGSDISRYTVLGKVDPMAISHSTSSMKDQHLTMRWFTVVQSNGEISRFCKANGKFPPVGKLTTL